MKNILLSTLVCFGLASCATTPSDPIQALVDSGATIIEGAPRSIIGDTGATYIDTAGKWTTYMGPNGRKVVKTKSGTTKELKWRVADDGRFCQDMFSDGVEECKGDEAVYLKDANGNHYIVIDGKKQPFKFTVVAGNTENL